VQQAELRFLGPAAAAAVAVAGFVAAIARAAAAEYGAAQ